MNQKPYRLLAICITLCIFLSGCSLIGGAVNAIGGIFNNNDEESIEESSSNESISSTASYDVSGFLESESSESGIEIESSEETSSIPIEFDKRYTPVQKVIFSEDYKLTLVFGLTRKLDYLDEYYSQNVNLDELINQIIFLMAFEPTSGDIRLSITEQEVRDYAVTEFNIDIPCRSTDLYMLDNGVYLIPSRAIKDYMEEKQREYPVTSEVREMYLNDDDTFTAVIDLYGFNDSTKNLLPVATKIAIIDITFEAGEYFNSYWFNLIAYT